MNALPRSALTSGAGRWRFRFHYLEQLRVAHHVAYGRARFPDGCLLVASTAASPLLSHFDRVSCPA